MATRQRSKRVSSDEAITDLQGQPFFSRHGGRISRELGHGKAENDASCGWWEVAAADGYKLRCEWLRTADEEQLRFSEMAPG
jgi:hypothetical protein